MANQRTDSKDGVVKVTLLKSPIGFNRNQATVVRSLGLRRIRHTVELKDTPATRGMIHKVRHLVEVVGVESWTSTISNRRRARSTPRSGSAAARDRATARPPAAGTRARSRAPGSSSSAASRAARCRCIAACRSAASTTRSASSTRSSTSTRSRRSSTPSTVVTPELLRERGLVPGGTRRVKVLARGEVDQEAHGPGAQVQRQSGGENRRRGRRN